MRGVPPVELPESARAKLSELQLARRLTWHDDIITSKSDVFALQVLATLEREIEAQPPPINGEQSGEGGDLPPPTARKAAGGGGPDDAPCSGWHRGGRGREQRVVFVGDETTPVLPDALVSDARLAAHSCAEMLSSAWSR
jgi:hypothetical protein